MCQRKYLVFGLKDNEVTEFYGTSSEEPSISYIDFDGTEKHSETSQIVDTTVRLPKQFLMGSTWPCKAWVNAKGQTQLVWVPLDSKPLSL